MPDPPFWLKVFESRFKETLSAIGADLNVYRCCVLAYNNRGLLGSIANQTFSELWWSEQVANMLNDFDATGCPRCMFNKKNETIRYALNPNPEHVNFL